MEIDKPYFMRNPRWYYFDEKEFRYKLTEKAPPRAQESYKEFYKIVNEEDKP